MYSEATLKNYVKDYSLPIQILREPYFSYFLDLYDKDFQSKAKYEMLKNTINLVGSEKEFAELRNKIRDNVINTIQETKAYSDFIASDLSRFDVPSKKHSTKDVYKLDNVGKFFLSIDLKKANFQALKLFYPDVVLYCNSYQEFIGRFTDLEYFYNSKKIRQVIFGNLNTKRQVKIQRFMMQRILDWAFEKKVFNEEDVRMVSSDEIVIEFRDLAGKFIVTELLEEDIKNDLGYDTRVESYQLNNIHDSQFFIKNFMSKDGYELMCVPLAYFAQVYKEVNDLELTEKDLCFMYEQKICRFVEPLFKDIRSSEEVA